MSFYKNRPLPRKLKSKVVIDRSFQDSQHLTSSREVSFQGSESNDNLKSIDLQKLTKSSLGIVSHAKRMHAKDEVGKDIFSSSCSLQERRRP